LIDLLIDQSIGRSIDCITHCFGWSTNCTLTSLICWLKVADNPWIVCYRSLSALTLPVSSNYQLLNIGPCYSVEFNERFLIVSFHIMQVDGVVKPRSHVS